MAALAFDNWGEGGSGVASKGKEEYLYSAILYTQSAQAWITQFYLQIPACLFFVSVHQMALSLTELTDIQLQLPTYLSTPKR